MFPKIKATEGLVSQAIVNNDGQLGEDEFPVEGSPRAVPVTVPSPSAQGDPLSLRFRSGFRLAFRCCPWVTLTEQDKIELTYTPSLSVKVNRCHTKETFFMAGDTAPSEATNGQAGGPRDGLPPEP